EIMTFNTELKYAQQLDSEDKLKNFRNEFYLNEDSIYMDGNSLGLLSKRAEQSTLALLESWKEHGIDGWTDGEHPSFFLSETLGGSMAILIGGKQVEVIVTVPPTENLHHLVSRFYQPDGKRTQILAVTL